MNVDWKFNRKPTCLKITVLTGKPEKIVIRVANKNKPATFYEDRYQVVNKKDVFYIKLPQSPEYGEIQVFNAKNGNLKEGQDKSFGFDVEEVPLRVYLLPNNINNGLTKDFIKFAQEFSEDLSVLSAGYAKNPFSVYRSPDDKLTIEYHNNLYDMRKMVPKLVRDHQGKIVPELIQNPQTGKVEPRMVPNRNFGKEVSTPMRTNAETGVIQVSKKYILQYTVPMRLAILLHEYSHFYLNNKPEDEEEADFNAILIFLALGYSKIAAQNAFIKVFKNADTQQNRVRDQKITDLINNFESMKFRLVA